MALPVAEGCREMAAVSAVEDMRRHDIVGGLNSPIHWRHASFGGIRLTRCSGRLGARNVLLRELRSDGRNVRAEVYRPRLLSSGGGRYCFRRAESCRACARSRL